MPIWKTGCQARSHAGPWQADWRHSSDHYYHPAQEESWSIQKVLPTIAPQLSYDKLDGVHDGGMAMTAYAEAIHPEVPVDKKQALE